MMSNFRIAGDSGVTRNMIMVMNAETGSQHLGQI
jgi:hypothetical protein